MKRKILYFLTSGAAIIAVFAALFLMGHPGGYDQYLMDAAHKLGSVAEQLKDESRIDPAGNELEIHFIDVGQADCTLLECAGKNMLVDAGNNDDGRMVVDFLKKQGVKTLDYIIGTHPHEDHIGGMDDVIDTFDVKMLILPDVDYGSKTYKDVLKAAAKKNLSITTAQPGLKYDFSEFVKFKVVAPCADYGDDLNNWSVGIRITHGNNDILMYGDGESASEVDMLASRQDLSAKLLKVSHHGSSTSSTEAFLDVVQPEYAVIMCGKNNEYGHPHKEVLQRLNERNVSVMRTDELGTITAVSDGEEFVFGASGQK